ncbi:hypothetical protein MODO_0778 [Myroides odoratimimus]|uniref:Uncharacterized protein n=1 Tax=Myroides odoratimimus CCUG 10230 TaxID=883150 RepID=A0ABP2N9T3_9FLAO|nr:hypothetical protein [Myroides odoratimimus]EHO08532.1 hypothetical protein HMPREF9712_02194 [Myroides odoratimimus CCUG 10230]EPH12400.1 hypothetical protein HMPREF9713_01241 [Myroides odoratimimus CCUG 12700]GAQ13131.1 hypothetical protein MODO_0778 [Myroides odoratimimus]STZ48380.1 Uncharacterised protein [Myroides odoratimimus]
MINYLKLFLKRKNNKEIDNTSLDFLTLQNCDNAVFILDNHLISKNKISYYNCNQNIDDIQVLYFTCINNKPLLFIAGKHNSHIPTSSVNFLPTFLHLAEKLGFNPVLLTIFEETFSCDRNMFVWARKNPSNCKVLEQGKYADTILQGYELQNQAKTFVSWETPYEDVIALDEVLVTQPSNEDDLIKYTFKVPVRIGNLVLNDFSFYDCHRKNIPVSNYFSYCEYKQAINKPYAFLKNALLENKSLTNASIDTEEDKTVIFSTKVKTEQLEFYFSNAYPVELDAANNKVFFLITNLKEYLNTVIYPEYILKLSIVNCTTLSGDITLDIQTYKETAHIYRVPTFIQEISQNKPFIWIDDNNDEIGFSDDRYAHIIPLAEVKYMCIETIEHSDGSINSKLSIRPNGSNMEIINIFTSKSVDLSKFKEQIKRDIPVPIQCPLDDYL